MKKVLLAAAFGIFGMANAQIQKGNWMVGGNVANMQFTNGLNVTLSPKAGYFVADRFVVGAAVDLSVLKGKGSSDVSTNWNFTPFARYYFTSAQIDSMLKNGAFFAEGRAGFGGRNANNASSTNGVTLGASAGYAYFITPNVSLEGMLTVSTVTGAGSSSATADLGASVGFNIYLPTKAVKAAARDRQ